MESSLRVHFLSDSMLKRLDSTFRYIGYSNYEGIIPAPGCEIEKICDLTTRYCHESELIVACFGINNLLNGCSVKHCMYLFDLFVF